MCGFFDALRLTVNQQAINGLPVCFSCFLILAQCEVHSYTSHSFCQYVTRVATSGSEQCLKPFGAVIYDTFSDMFLQVFDTATSTRVIYKGKRYKCRYGNLFNVQFERKKLFYKQTAF